MVLESYYELLDFDKYFYRSSIITIEVSIDIIILSIFVFNIVS